MSKHQFKNRTVVITGASSGIGRALAYEFAGRGANVVLGARHEDQLTAIAADLARFGIRTAVCATDVTKADDCRRLIDTAVETFGGIDILICNAGISMRALFDDVDLDVLHRLMDVNFWGTVYCTKYALPYLLQAKGSVVGVISIAGFAGLPGRTGYASSKYAIRGFLDTLRIEHLYDGLHVMVFAPGFTASNVRNAALTADGHRQGKTPRDEGKMMTAEKVAEYMAKGLAGRKSEMILTPIGKLTVFMHNILPRLTDRLEFSYMAKEPDSPFHKK